MLPAFGIPARPRRHRADLRPPRAARPHRHAPSVVDETAAAGGRHGGGGLKGRDPGLGIRDSTKRNRRPDTTVSRYPCPLLPRSEEHTSELQSLMRISYAVFCLKKKHTTS